MDSQALYPAGSSTTTIQLPQQNSTAPASNSSSYTLRVILHAPLMLQQTQAKPLKEYSSAVEFAEDLTDIILANGEQNDRLSGELRLEATRFAEMILVADMELPTDAELPPEVVRTHLTALKKLLSLGKNRPLQRPCIMRGECVGEEFALELYCRAYNRVLESQNDGEKSFSPLIFAQEATPHFFAEDILRWMERLEGPRAAWPEPSPAAAEVGSATPMRDPHGFPMLRGVKAKRKEPINTRTEFPCAGQSGEPLDLDVATKFYLKFEKFRNAENRIRDNEIRAQAIKRATQAIRAENQLLKQQNALDAERLKRGYIALLEDHELAKAYFSARLNKLQAALNDLAEKQQKEVGELNKKYLEEKFRLGEALMKIYQLNVRVSNLEASNHQLQGKVRDLTDEVNGMDGGGCVIA